MTALFIGCLFPSFDDLKNDRVQHPSVTGDDDASTELDAASSSGSTGGTTSGETSTSSGGVADTGADTKPPEKKTISCGGKTCDADTQVCCDEGFGNTSCKPKGGSCTPWTIGCDDLGDCPTGQVCCHPNGTLEVRCSASCNGDEICQTGKPCKTGTCGGTLAGPPEVSVRVCN